MQDKSMETKLGKAKPGFYKFYRKDPSEKSGRVYGLVFVTGKPGYQGGYKTPQIEFIPLGPQYRFQAYSESATIRIETVSNKEGLNAIFSR